MDDPRDRDHLRVIIQLALAKLTKLLSVALDRRSEHRYDAHDDEPDADYQPRNDAGIAHPPGSGEQSAQLA